MNRPDQRSLAETFTSTLAMASLALKRTDDVGLVKLNPRPAVFASGQKLSSFAEIGLMRFAGMVRFGNGWPVKGSMISVLNRPARSPDSGTCPVRVRSS